MGGFTSVGTLGLIAEYFLKTTVVLTLALLAAAASRRRPAAFRHFVLSFALVGLLLLPLLSLTPVGWRTSLLPARPAETRAQTVLPGRPDASPALDFRNSERNTVRVSETAPPASAAAGTAEQGLERFAEPAAAVTTRLPDASSSHLLRQASDPGPRDGAAAGFPVNIVLAVLWAAGLVALALRLAFGLAGAVKLTAQGEALGDPAWRVLLERFKALVSLRRKIRLKGHPEVLVPMTWGWRKPVILMPAGADAWTEEERSSALFHELSHVKRADFLVMLLVRTSLAAFWFNPLCWVVYRELRKEQEIACDELVLHAGIKPSTYAASLLAFRRSAGFRWNPSAAMLGMLGRSSFHERLAAILKQKLTFKEVKMKTKIMLASAVVLAVALVGTARPAVGIEKNAARTTVVESALPAPAVYDVAPPALAAQEKQTEKVIVQEKEKEKAKKEKAAAKTPIVITITEGDVVKTMTLTKPLTITTGKDGKTLILTSEGKEIQVLEGEPLHLDKPLTITSEKDGHVLVLTSEGKEFKVLKGEPLRLEIKGGEIGLIKEGKALEVGEGGVYTIVKEGDKDGSKIVFYGTTKGAAVEAAPEVFVKRMKEIKEGEKWVAAEPGKAFTFSPAIDKDMLEKVHALQEQVAAIKAKKMDINALEESLMKLEAELKAKEEKFGELKMKFEKAPASFTIAKKIGGDEAKGDVIVYEKLHEDMVAGKGGTWVAKADAAQGAVKVMVTDDKAINLVFSASGDAGMDAAAFERAVAKLKKELPKGFKLEEQKFDEQAGTMTFKISSPEGAKIDEKLVRKLVDSVKIEIKTKK